MKRQPEGDIWRIVSRAARIGLLLAVLGIGGISVAAWLLGDQANLPFDYEGFD